MSEFQYYEFRAVDRPLSDADRTALRALSTRAGITATSFMNHYEWGDLKGRPSEWMERWFDLHLYFSNWGTRVLMIRLPRRLFDLDELSRLVVGNDSAEIRDAGEHLIVSITRESEEPDEWIWYDEDQSELLNQIAPVRAELLAGDLRLFSLLWLIGLEDELLEHEPADHDGGLMSADDGDGFDLLAGEPFDRDRPEPAVGLDPLTPALEAVASFLRLDGNLLRAAAERPYATASPSAEDACELIAGLPDRERVGMLVRLYDNDPYVAVELRRLVRRRLAAGDAPSRPKSRTAGELIDRARVIREDQRRARAEQVETERRREADRVERERQKRLDLLRKRGDAVWDEIEVEIERRNASGYDQAARLLTDLAALADEGDAFDDFAVRLESIRDRHARKPRFIERLADL